MKRFAWLLVFPYVVMISSYPAEYRPDKNRWVIVPRYSVGPFACGIDRDACDDMAEALNAAHIRRANPPPNADWIGAEKRAEEYKAIRECMVGCMNWGNGKTRETCEKECYMSHD